MENVTDRLHNPFDMHHPCSSPCSEEVEAVYGYGDPNADFHVIGDHPGIHGGGLSGVPFGDGPAGDRLRPILESVGLLESVDGSYRPVNTFLSYLHACCPSGDTGPTEDDYTRLERFFDAELRAISAHVLIPVGERPIAHVLREFTAKATKLGDDIASIHGDEIRGRGFLVVPVAEPMTWNDEAAAMVRERLQATIASDYRQASDLTRFIGTGDIYLVR